MIRDFSESAKQKLLQFVKDTTETGVWGKIGDAIGDAGNHVLNWLGWLNIKRYVDNLDTYHRKVIDKNDATCKQIETIFSNVYGIDGRYAEGLMGEVGVANSICQLLKDLSETINPNGGNLDMTKYASVLAADVEKLHESKATQESITENKMLGTDPEGASTSVDPVNLSTGNFIYEHRDLTITGEIELKFHRYYNSKDSKILTLGKGFRHNYDINLLIKAENKCEIVLADGQYRYFEKENNEYQSVNGISESLEHIDGIYVYINEAQEKYYFNDNGVLLRIENINQRGITFEYNDSNLLTRAVTDNDTYLTYTYDENGYVSKIVDVIGREVCIAYANNYLVEVKLPEDTKIGYSYAKNGRINTVINSNKNVAVQNDYDNKFRVTKQTFLDDSEMHFIYDDSNNRVTQIERNGAKTVFIHDDQYRNIETVYHDGSCERFVYNDRNQCISKIDRNGHATRVSYDNRGNITQIIDSTKRKMNFTYDAKNCLLSVRINGKERVKNSYDKKGNLILTEDGLGNKTSIKYNDNGQKIYEKNANGEFTYIYDAKGNLSEIYQGISLVGRYEYDALNRIVLEVDSNENHIVYEYDALDRIIKEINSDQKVKELFYESNNDKPVKIIDYDGSIINNEYDKLGRLISTTDKNGNTTRYTYDTMWNISSVIEPNGAVTNYEYDLNNRLSRVIFPNLGETLYEYDYVGNRIKMTDPDGNVTRFIYNADNSVQSVVEANGAETHFEYDIDGNLILIRDAMNNTVSMEYDIMGNKTRYTDEYGYSTYMEYSEYGRLKQIMYSTGGISKYEYDDLGRLSCYIDETGGVEKFVYDSKGNVIKKIVNEETTEYLYDNNNRVVKVINPVGGIREFKYDMFDNILCTIDENGAVTEYEYNADGTLKQVVEQQLLKTEYDYDVMGNIVRISKHGNDEVQNTKFEWDLLGNLVKTISPLGNSEEYFYSKAGKLIKKIDAESLITSYKYNFVGDIEEIVYGDNRSAKFKYNLLKQLECIEDWNGKTYFELNKSGMPLKVTDYNGNVVQYEWDSRNEKTKVVYPDGTDCSYKYNASKQLVEMKIGDKTTKYSYDEFGRFACRINDEGIKTQYMYNQLGRIDKVVNSASNEILEEYCYQFDLLGNKTRTTYIGNDGNETLEYAYDKVGRISAVHRNNMPICTYQYDAFGNRIRKNDLSKKIVTDYFYNGENQLLREVCGDSIIEYQYDRRGNLNVLNRPDEKVVYDFGATNRLEKVVRYTADRESTKEYRYGVLGQRIEEKCYAEKPLANVTYLIDYTRKCHNILAKYINHDGNLEREQYYYDGKIASMSNNCKELSYLLSDDHGSCTMMLSGNKKYKRRYNEFGEIISDDEFMCDFGYTGFMYDDYTREYYAHARMYDPKIGRFTGQDKFRGVIMSPQTLNRYTYCCNRPEDYEDDDGEWITVAIGAAVGGLVSAAVSVGTQVIDGVKSGKSVGESFKSVNYKEVAIETAKGAVKGAIAGTGLGVVATAAIGAGVDMAGDVAKQTIVDGKSIKEVDGSKVVETGIFSFGFSMVVGGVSKAVQGKITDKLGINTKMSDLKGREAAVNTVKEQLSKAKAKSRINKLTARLADKTREYWQTAGKYTLNKFFGGAYGMIQSSVYKKKLKSWITGEMDEFYHCTLAA